MTWTPEKHAVVQTQISLMSVGKFYDRTTNIYFIEGIKESMRDMLAEIERLNNELAIEADGADTRREKP